MTDPKAFLLKLNESLSTLRERKAKYGGNVPLELLNQIEDYEKAIDLTERTIDGEISRAEWREALKPLLLSIEVTTSVSQLETYIDRMSGLLLKENLRESRPGDLVRNIARTRTLEVLRSLDGEEKVILLRFLYEAELIDKDKKVIDLRGADFRGGLDFHRAKLSRAKYDSNTIWPMNFNPAHLGAVHED